MNDKKEHIIAIMLSFIGGILDIYCLMNFNLYATLHTGNIIKLATCLVDKNYYMFIATFLIILFFGVGIYIANVIENSKKGSNIKKLFIASIVLLIISLFVPNDAPQGELSSLKMLSAIIFGLEGAFIIHSFVSFGEFYYSATTMTSNVNRLVTSVYKRVHDKDKNNNYGILTYLFIFLFFMLGVAVGYLYLTSVPNFENEFMNLYKYNFLIIIPIILMMSCLFITSVKDKKGNNKK